MRLTLLAGVLALLTGCASAHRVYTLESGISSPTRVKEVKPLYTDGARAARIEGDVIMRAIILPDGTVGDVTVTKSLDRVYGLDEQAVAAVRQWAFKPALKDGRPVAVRMDMTIRFTLAN